MRKKYLLIFCLFTLSCTQKETPAPKIQVVGAMRNVMMKGELAGNISLDTIANKKNLYGLGPVEYLTGEILIIDGQAYQSKVLTDSTMTVEENFALNAPFFVYANVDKWNQYPMPDSIQNLKQLEGFLDEISKSVNVPFAIKVEGNLEAADIHLVNLPAGSIVRSPQDAHQGQVNYNVTNPSAKVIGFFSRKHKSIFTHHDSFVHMHLITKDNKMMGHVDNMEFKAEKIQLWISF